MMVKVQINFMRNHGPLTLPIKGADFNRYTFSLLSIEEMVYLFKSAHFNNSTR